MYIHRKQMKSGGGPVSAAIRMPNTPPPPVSTPKYLFALYIHVFHEVCVI